MLLRPYSLKQINKSITTLSPKGNKKSTYLRFKTNKQKSAKGGRSMCSIQTNRQSTSLTNRRMLSHRKLISALSLQPRQNLTDRRHPTQTQQQTKNTAQAKTKNQQNQNNNEKSQRQNSNKKRFHLNKFLRNNQLKTIQNQQNDNNIEKALEIKQNILKQFIDRFQEELKQISQQKSTRQTLSTHRTKGQNILKVKEQPNYRMKTQHLKESTTKKHRNIITSLQSNGSTINLSKCAQKQNIFSQLQDNEKNNFQQYIKQLKQHKKKDQKIFIMKNHKKSLQNITISKIGETETITSRISRMETKNKLNLKQLFRHSKKYQPYLKDTATLIVNPHKVQKIEQSQQKLQKLQKSSLATSPIRSKLNHQKKQASNQIDCSSIQQMNQSSFISEVGRKSLLKHLDNQSAKIIKEQQRKTKKCLAKMKSIFPSNFF